MNLKRAKNLFNLQKWDVFREKKAELEMQREEVKRKQMQTK